MNASQLRRKVRRIYAQMAACIEGIVGRSPLFAASLYEHKTRCGNPRCRCAAGPCRHRQWCVSFVEEGRGARWPGWRMSAWCGTSSWRTRSS